MFPARSRALGAPGTKRPLSRRGLTCGSVLWRFRPDPLSATRSQRSCRTYRAWPRGRRASPRLSLRLCSPSAPQPGCLPPLARRTCERGHTLLGNQDRPAYSPPRTERRRRPVQTSTGSDCFSCPVSIDTTPNRLILRDLNHLAPCGNRGQWVNLRQNSHRNPCHHALVIRRVQVSVVTDHLHHDVTNTQLDDLHGRYFLDKE